MICGYGRLALDCNLKSQTSWLNQKTEGAAAVGLWIDFHAYHKSIIILTAKPFEQVEIRWKRQ
jgi:hypothetical protein